MEWYETNVMGPEMEQMRSNIAKYEGQMVDIVWLRLDAEKLREAKAELETQTEVLRAETEQLREGKGF